MMDASAVPRDRRLHFVGSIPLPDGETVMRTLAARFAPWLPRIPDGETGERTNWIQYQEDVFAAMPAFEWLSGTGDARSVTAKRPQAGKCRLKSGATLSPDDFGDLGYARAAIESWLVFHDLRARGDIPPGHRYMVPLPSPYNVISFSVMPESQAEVEIAYEARLLRELDAILAAVPHDALSIQWDCAHDMQAFDGARTPWFAPVKPGIAERLVRLGNRVPEAVDLGYHLCYGSFGGRHFVEPESMAAMVELSNAIVAGLGRRLDFMHMPVPIERDDDAYFAPLRALARPADMEVYLGLIHERDGVAGTMRRHQIACRHLDAFGVATECGFGRMRAEAVPGILETHEQVMRALDANG